ncbi:MAG: RNA polymerase sigma-70 factor, partial [Bacteroidales bacterium]|nr:RNA polymerase sigma-70 factor [Candidatus Cryptobacteroides caccocaballi]
PEKTRNTFLMSRRDGLSNREIARKEKVSVKAIEYRISQALKNFRKIKESF